MLQGSEEWFAARCGRFTSSRFSDLMARTKKGVSKLHENLIVRVAIERLTGRHFDTYESAAMARGKMLEEQARQAYEQKVESLVEEIALVAHPQLAYVSVSPDGFVGREGLVEIKCPFAEAKHFGAIKSSDHCREYRWQIQGLLWVTGRSWCDAVSFDPRFPEDLQLQITRVYPCAGDIKALDEQCRRGEDEVLKMLEEIQERRDEKGRQGDRQKS